MRTVAAVPFMRRYSTRIPQLSPLRLRRPRSPDPRPRAARSPPRPHPTRYGLVAAIHLSNRQRDSVVGRPSPRSQSVDGRRVHPEPSGELLPGKPQPLTHLREPRSKGQSGRLRGVAQEIVDRRDTVDTWNGAIPLPLPDAGLNDAYFFGNFPLEQPQLQPLRPDVIAQGPELLRVSRILGFSRT